jgi:hypothetical protein
MTPTKDALAEDAKKRKLNESHPPIRRHDIPFSVLRMKEFHMMCTENYLSLIFRKINDFVHRFILHHKSVDFTILVVNFTILYY